MNALAKIFLAGVASAALLTSAAIAQDSEDTNILDSVGDTVDSTVDSVNDVTNDLGVEDTVDDVTNDLGVEDTVDDVTNDLGVEDTVDDITSDVTGGDVDAVDDITGGDSSVGDIGNFSDLVGSIEGGNLSDTDFTGVTDFQIVDVSEAFDDFDATALNDALSGNDTNISDLQNEISGNSALSDALSGNNIDVSDIVALENHNNGSVTIYTSSQE